MAAEDNRKARSGMDINLSVSIAPKSTSELQQYLMLLSKFRGDSLFGTILSKLEAIQMTQAELKSQLDTVSATLDSVGDGITKVSNESTASLAEIKRLNDLIAAGGPITPELQAAAQAALDKATALSTAIKAVDDLIPD